jgi:hypothetical protein
MRRDHPSYLEGILRKILALLALAVVMVPVPALAELTITPVATPNSPIAITTCFGRIDPGSGFVNSSANIFNRSKQNASSIVIRYQYLDDQSRVIKSYEFSSPINIGSGDTDAVTQNVPPPLVGDIQAHELRCIPVSATIGGKSWKRGDVWPETLLPLPSPGAK